jgi:hypothetical protein
MIQHTTVLFYCMRRNNIYTRLYALKYSVNKPIICIITRRRISEFTIFTQHYYGGQTEEMGDKCSTNWDDMKRPLYSVFWKLIR